MILEIKDQYHDGTSKAAAYADDLTAQVPPKVSGTGGNSCAS